ncbi:MAG: diguanylate cyclase domain-containing protein, partial [Candidatus Methylumidiphilus sp.]
MDRFKTVNDTLGHCVGDAILVTVAERLRETMREVDILARLGGDEFVVVLPCIAEVSDTIAVARKLTAALGETMDIAGHLLTVTASIGISLYPEDGADY